MRVGRSRDICLCTSHNGTIMPTFSKVQVKIRVLLLMWMFATITLRISQCNSTRQVPLLNHSQICLETVIIVGLKLHIDKLSCLGKRSKRIMCQIALSTTGRAAKQTAHFQFTKKIISTRIQSNQSIDLLTRWQRGEHDRCQFRIEGQLLGERNGIDSWLE